MAISTKDRRTIFDADGNGGAFSIPCEATRMLSGQGTFGGGTLTLQIFCGLNVAGDTELWRAFAGFSLTAVGHAILLLPAGRYRFSLTGATAPSIAALCGE